MKRCIMGIDPGLDGAICWLTEDEGAIEIFDMPTLSLSKNGRARREVDAHEVARRIRTAPYHAFIEQSWPRPTDGAMQGFKFGQGYGILLGVLAARDVPVTKVSPQSWKRDLRLDKGKDAARARASELMPYALNFWPLKKHDGRAEAALIALWGVRSLNAIASGKAA